VAIKSPGLRTAPWPTRYNTVPRMSKQGRPSSLTISAKGDARAGEAAVGAQVTAIRATVSTPARSIREVADAWLVN